MISIPYSVFRGGRMALSLATCSSLLAADKITYDDHIFPIFEASCLNCHNPDKKKGDLDLSNYSGAMAGGSGGAVAEPGNGAGSKIYASVTHTAEPFMPPKGDKISKKDADLIRAWVDGGLLENASSQAKKRSGPRIAAIEVDPTARPEGPPPMPGHLNLEPVVTSVRNTVVNDMACSPWAPLLAITAQKQILLYNTDTLQLAAILPFPKGFPETVSFHPTGKYLMAGGGIAGKSGTTYTWEVPSGKLVMENGQEFDSVLAASLRLDLGAVALGGPARLIKLWDTQTGEQVKSIKKHTDWVTAVAYSPDGVLLATGDRNGGALVWEAETGNEFHTLRGHDQGITALGWRADSNILATASEDGQVIFWEMNNGQQVKKFGAHGGGTLSFDYARTGEFVTSGRDNKVKIWNADFNLKKELPAFGDMVVEVAITQDGKRVFTADWNGKIEAWDSTEFTKVGELEGAPPRIADRIATLSQTVAEASNAAAQARSAFEAAQAAVTDAQASLQKTLEDREAAMKLAAQLTEEKSRLDQSLAALDGEREKLIASRENLRSGAAEQALGELEAQLKKIEADCQTTTERQSQIGPEQQAVSTTLDALEKALNPAQENVAAREKALADPKAAYEQAQAHEAKLLADLKFWQAAEVNSKALAVTAEYEALRQQQESDTQAFDSISKQLTQFRDELSRIDSRKDELTKLLEKLAPEIAELRTSIDERAPALSKLEKESTDLRTRYAEMSK